MGQLQFSILGPATCKVIAMFINANLTTEIRWYRLDKI